MSGMHFEDFHQFIISGGMKPGKSTFLKSIKNLQQKNVRLKEENEILKQVGKTLAEVLHEQNEFAIKYKSALDEIEKYCKNFGCNNCIESKRCKEKQDNKNSLINYLIMQIGEIEDKPLLMQNLKNAIPNITRCDVAIIKKILQIINLTKEVANEMD